MICKENPKESTKKLVNVINRFSSGAVCKINMQKSFVFLYSSNKQTKIKLRNNSIYNSSKRKKTLGNKLNKRSLGLELLNYKIMLIEIKEDLISGKTSHIYGSKHFIL